MLKVEKVDYFSDMHVFFVYYQDRIEVLGTNLEIDFEGPLQTILLNIYFFDSQ